MCVVNRERERELYNYKEKIKFTLEMEGMLTNQRLSTTTINGQRRLSSKRASRVRIDSISTTNNDGRGDLLVSQSIDDVSVKDASGLLQKYDKSEMCELLATRDAHWFLTNGDIYKVFLLN